MRMAAARALLALTLLAVRVGATAAQDTTVAARHLLPLDTSRVRPYRRAFDILVNTRDSALVIGQREVVLSSALYAGTPVWLLVETRTGVVPAAESLYVAPDMRPLHMSSTLGAARIGIEFVGDSIFGATSWPGGRNNVVLEGRPNLLASTTMIETLLPLLPLTAQWSDSVGVLVVDPASSTVVPAELAVIGEEELPVDSAATRPVWVVALRADARNVLFWIDKEVGTVFKVQQALPAHVGLLLEYRIRQEAQASAPPPPPPASPPR